jgi:hypothetical protein
MERMEKIHIRVVAYQVGDLWIAQGVEYDIMARAKSLTTLPKAFNRALMSNLCVNDELGREGLDGIPPAPDHFREVFEGATLDVITRDPAVRPGLDIRVAEAA